MEKYEVINALIASGYWLEDADEFENLRFKRQTNNCVSEAIVSKSHLAMGRFLVDEDDNKIGKQISGFFGDFTNLQIEGKACMDMNNYTSIVL